MLAGFQTTWPRSTCTYSVFPKINNKHFYPSEVSVGQSQFCLLDTRSLSGKRREMENLNLNINCRVL